MEGRFLAPCQIIRPLQRQSNFLGGWGYALRHEQSEQPTCSRRLNSATRSAKASSASCHPPWHSRCSVSSAGNPPGHQCSCGGPWVSDLLQFQVGPRSHLNRWPPLRHAKSSFRSLCAFFSYTSVFQVHAIARYFVLRTHALANSAFGSLCDLCKTKDGFGKAIKDLRSTKVWNLLKRGEGGSQIYLDFVWGNLDPPPPPKKSEFSFRRLCRKFLTLLTNPCPNSAPNGVLRGLCGLIFQLSASRRAKTRSFDRATDWGVPTGGVSPYHPLNPHYIEPWATHTMNVVQYGVSYFFPQCSLMIRARGDTR